MPACRSEWLINRLVIIACPAHLPIAMHSLPACLPHACLPRKLDPPVLRFRLPTPPTGPGRLRRYPHLYLFPISAFSFVRFLLFLVYAVYRLLRYAGKLTLGFVVFDCPGGGVPGGGIWLPGFSGSCWKSKLNFTV